MFALLTSISSGAPIVETIGIRIFASPFDFNIHFLSHGQFLLGWAKKAHQKTVQKRYANDGRKDANPNPSTCIFHCDSPFSVGVFVKLLNKTQGQGMALTCPVRKFLGSKRQPLFFLHQN